MKAEQPWHPEAKYIRVTSKTATNENGHRLKRPQSNTKTATFYQQGRLLH